MECATGDKKECQRHHYVANDRTGARKLLRGQDVYRATVASLVQRKRPAVPLWVRALEAWVEGRYPIGAHGYVEAREVVEQVILHYEQEAELKGEKE